MHLDLLPFIAEHHIHTQIIDQTDMLTAKQIRESFKDFSAQKGHKIVPSAPMVVKDDLTLMFTNAGMNPL